VPLQKAALSTRGMGFYQGTTWKLGFTNKNLGLEEFNKMNKSGVQQQKEI